MESQREYKLHTFDNGIRWVHKQVKHTRIAHCGIMLDIGSRDEKPHELGLAHFWEHMAFKGTKTKKSNYIINRIDSLGGELNAYTTKEKICFHASLLDEHYERAIQLLTDITFNSIFPEKEIEKERSVILEEMSMYADDPEDSIQDDFDGVVFASNPLGNNILGIKESVTAFKQEDFLNFVQSNMDTHRLVISTVGNIEFDKIKKVIQKYIEPLPTIRNTHQRSIATTLSTNKIQLRKPITQAHCMLGRRAYSIKDERRLSFFMLTNLLGGQAMNSRLNLSVREKHGLAYTVDAQYTAFVDTGLFSIYFGTEKKQLAKATGLVLHELKRFRNDTLTSTQLKAAKDQFKGQLAMSEENNNGLMLLLAKSTLDLGYVESIESLFHRIDKVTAFELQELAKEMFLEENLCSLIYLPEK